MMTRPLNELTASDIAAAVLSGRTTCEAVVRACIERIEAREPDVQAWQYFDADQAIAAARLLDRSGQRGPLLGVPFNVKDIIETGDMPTEYGSPIYKGFRARADASCVALSRRAGGRYLRGRKAQWRQGPAVACAVDEACAEGMLRWHQGVMTRRPDINPA